MKSKFYLLVAAAMMLTYQSFSQCNQNINLTTQAQVDAFPVTYGCTSLTGSLTIQGTGITNLDSLEAIISIIGNVTIDQTGLADANGLNHLQNISGSLRITGNNALTHVDALGNMSTLGKALITSQSLYIEGNPMLASLNGFSGIRTLPGHVQITNNDALVNLHGLDSIKSIIASLVISGNDILEDIDGISSLKYVQGNLSITENPALKNIDGLQSFSSIGGSMSSGVTISFNNSLTNINGLASLHDFGGVEHYLNIVGNPVLTEACAIYPLLRDNLNCVVCGNHIDIRDNGPNVTYDGIMTTCVTPENKRCDINFNLTSQVQVDAFKKNYGCSVVQGSVTIKGTDITNIDSLITLEKVEHLMIDATSITNVNGLASLQEVNGTYDCPCYIGLTIRDNNQLTDISGLSSLKRVETHLQFLNLPLLQSVHGLEALDTLGGSLGFFNMPALTSLEGLSNLKAIGQVPNNDIPRINLDNTGLVNLHGLENLTSIPGILDISNNTKLTSIDGLQGVTFIGSTTTIPRGALIVNKNASLQNVDGLSNLETVVSEIQIGQNPALKNVDGLRSLTTVGQAGSEVANLYITDNDSLSNIDGLSSLAIMTATLEPWPRLNVTGNDLLTRFCGLYKIISENGISGCDGPDCEKIQLDHITGEQIVQGGPCVEGSDPGQPTGIGFSDVTDTTMTVSFIPSPDAAGYITVMRSFESSYPEFVPIDGVQYHVGSLIGSSSIVVGMGTETELNIVWLNPDTDYWFDVYSYSNSGQYNYVTSSSLQGMQRTLPTEAMARNAWPNPFVDRVTIPFTTDTSDNVRVVIFDSAGANIAEVANNSFAAGKHEVVWNGTDRNGSNVPVGTYFYHVLKSNGALRGRLTK